MLPKMKVKRKPDKEPRQQTMSDRPYVSFLVIWYERLIDDYAIDIALLIEGRLFILVLRSEQIWILKITI